jgi:hypothetical protein
MKLKKKLKKLKKRNRALERAAKIASAAFQRLLAIGTTAARHQGGTPSSLGTLVFEFGKSLRPDQVSGLMSLLDMEQKLVLVEVLNAISSAPEFQPSAAPSAPNGSLSS